MPTPDAWFHDNLGVIIIITTGLLIAILAVFWVFLWRPGLKHHKRKRHSERRKSNPTLAETGGLPPVRETPPRDPKP